MVHCNKLLRNLSRVHSLHLGNFSLIKLILFTISGKNIFQKTLTVLYQFLETGTSDKTLIGLDQILKWLGFSLFPPSVFLNSPFKGTVSIMFKWPSMKRWQCPIHNATLKTCLMKCELDISISNYRKLIIFNTKVTCALYCKKWIIKNNHFET